jgi:hypothetical protein
MKLGKPMLYAVDTKELPGKVRLRFVTFTERAVDKAEFETATFDLCDRHDPRMREFLEIAKESP